MANVDNAQSAFAVTLKGNTETIIMDNDDIRDIYFVEDIYSYLMAGCMVCRDARGLSEFLPLIGNETITIDYGTAEEGKSSTYKTKTYTFKIIKIDQIENTNSKQRHMLKFFFIDEPHKRLQMEHYSRSYKCLTYTDMVTDILERHAGMPPGKFLNKESCPEVLQYFYTGLKTPAQNVEWLLSRCHSETSGQPGFLLYSSTQDENLPYNLRTLETLLQQKTLMPPYGSPEYYTIHSHNPWDINRILKYDVNKPDHKSLERMMKYVNLGFDIQRKKHLKNIYTYDDALAKFTCLGNFSLFEVASNAILSTAQELSGEVEEMEIMKNIYFGDWIKRYCLQHTVSIIIEGHAERYCGGMIAILWPTSSDDELFDKNMDGLYLVKSITHFFSPLQKPVYSQRMILIKNGYDDSDGSLTAAAKPNTKASNPIKGTWDNNVRGL